MSNSVIDTDLERELLAQLSDARSSFAIGAFGAVAEFFRDDDEPLAVDDPQSLTLASARGAIRISLRDDVLPLAYETVSARKLSWLNGVALCLPRAEATSAQRNGVTELGPDTDAIRRGDRSDVLFDMGLGTANVDFCVRTGDPALIAALRKARTGSLLAPGSEVMEKIIAAGPHRVALSKLGRVEVFQAIGRHKTPVGPHTHVLPKLLRTRRTHDAKIPIPQGYLPCLNLYPPSPLFDALGEPKTYDAGSQAAFETLLAKWGQPRYVAQKELLRQMIDEDNDPASFPMPATRLERSAVRIALRELAHDGTLRERTASWRERFDRE